VIAQRQEIQAAHGAALEHSALELLMSGTTVLSWGEDRIEARLVRFWNGSGIVEARLPSPSGSEHRTYSLLDRRELRQDPVSHLARNLLSAMVNLTSHLRGVE
jgi:hypothetical protein